MTQAALGEHNGSHGKGCGDAPVTVESPLMNEKIPHDTKPE
jgi:hypothetical protein